MLPARHNEWMPDIFNDFFDTNWMDRPKATCPAINVIETPEAYELQLAAPGMTKEDFNVNLDEEGDLVINMEKKVDNKEKEHKGHFLRREFSYTKFQQTMLLPFQLDLPDRNIGFQAHLRQMGLDLENLVEEDLQGVPVALALFHGCAKLRNLGETDNFLPN